MTDKQETIKIEGYSVGDMSVGIPSIEFSVDTGLYELSEDDKEFLIKGIVRDIWELHDNGNLHYDFSDEIKDDNWDYTRRMNGEISNKILDELKKQIRSSGD